MKVSNPLPGKNIADYVARMLVIEHCSVTGPFTLPLFANGTPTLLFITAPSSIDGKPTGYLTLFGQTVFPEELVITENFTLIACFFKPFVLHSLFGISAKELTDFPIGLDLLSSARTNELKERLLNAGSTEAMLDLLGRYIFSLVTRKKTASQMARYATGMIAGDSSIRSLARVQQELHVTERTFQREFERSIGISPNLFRRICQFDAAFRQLNSRRFIKLSDVAFENGFADQSHFIRTFKEFTNLTPREYLSFGEPS